MPKANNITQDNVSQADTNTNVDTNVDTNTVTTVQSTIANNPNQLNSYTANTMLASDAVVALYARKISGGKISICIKENIPMYRKKNATAPSYQELSFAQMANLSDDRFNLSYSTVYASGTPQDLGNLLGVDLVNPDIYTLNETGQEVAELNILNPVCVADIAKGRRFRVKLVRSTTPSKSIDATTGQNYDLSHLNDTHADGTLKSSAMQRGKGGAIITCKGKPVFDKSTVDLVPIGHNPTHLMLDFDENTLNELAGLTTDASNVTIETVPSNQVSADLPSGY